MEILDALAEFFETTMFIFRDDKTATDHILPGASLCIDVIIENSVSEANVLVRTQASIL